MHELNSTDGRGGRKRGENEVGTEATALERNSYKIILLFVMQT